VLAPIRPTINIITTHNTVPRPAAIPPQSFMLDADNRSSALRILSDVVVQPVSASEDRTISMVACLKAG